MNVTSFPACAQRYSMLLSRVVALLLTATCAVHANYYANGPTTLALFPNTLCLERSPGSAVSDQWVNVWNAGTGVLHYTVTATDVWISSISPTNGTSSAGTATAHRVVFNPAPLASGMQPARIWLTAPAATNSPQYVQVFLDTLATGAFGNVFRWHVVTNVPGSYTVDNALAADLDRDGWLDIVAVYGNVIAWWRNDGQMNFTNMSVIDGNFTGAIGLDVGDMDNDGDNDVLAAAQTDSDVAWFENNGRMQFVEHTIDGSFSGARRAFLVDMDHDQDLDVVAAAENAGDIAWWRNDGGGVFTNKNVIDANFAGVRNIVVRDLDGDGNCDIAGAGAVADALAWWRNTGNVSFVKITIVSNYPSACAIDAADFDRDGDTDFIGSSLDDNEIAWFENTGSYSNFIRHQIIWTVDCYAITAADVDNNGIVDFFASDSPSANDFFWCQNDGLQNFTRRNIDTSQDLATICVVDLDGDGWLDALGGAGNLLSWYQSGGTAVLALARAPAVLAQEVLLGANATNQWFSVWNSGQFGLLSYTVAEQAPWITALTPADGTCTNEVPHEHRVTFSTTALAEGSYQTNVSITASAAVNSPQAVQVIVDVVPEPALWLVLAVLGALRAARGGGYFCR